MSISSFPMLYHAHHQAYKQDLPFWQSLTSSSVGPILELGCGTGRVIASLVSEGHSVFGLDMDIGMLNYAQKILPDVYKCKVQFIQADMTNFNFAFKFDSIILPCNTFTTLSVSEREQTLKCVRKHLKEGGTFIFSNPNQSKLDELDDNSLSEIETVITHPESGYPVQVSSEFEISPGFTKITWHYDHLFENGKVERNSFSSEHAHLTEKKLRNTLSSQGYSNCTLYGDFDFSAYTLNSPYIIALAS